MNQLQEPTTFRQAGKVLETETRHQFQRFEHGVLFFCCLHVLAMLDQRAFIMTHKQAQISIQANKLPSAHHN